MSLAFSRTNEQSIIIITPEGRRIRVVVYNVATRDVTVAIDANREVQIFRGELDKEEREMMMLLTASDNLRAGR